MSEKISLDSSGLPNYCYVNIDITTRQPDGGLVKPHWS